MFKNPYLILLFIVSLTTSFVFSSLFSYFLIARQIKKHEGQTINSYLTFHNSKTNTPSLGGIAITIGVILSTIFYLKIYLNSKYLVLIITYLLFFIIGLIDDLIKVKGKNYHGLSSYLRFFSELLISIIAFYILSKEISFDFFNLFKGKLYIGNFSILLFSFILLGSSNGMNLSDGLDGLSSSLFLLCVIPFILFSLISKEYYLTCLLLSAFGSVLGFIVFNLHPSKLFMGDSGSLSLGLLLGFSSIILKKEIILIISGGLIIFETISVIIQVLFFKLFHKRVFLMAPFHHHLELKGMKEYQIVMMFFIIGLFLLLLSVVTGLLSF